MNNFNDIVKMFLGMIEEKAQQIETEKLTVWQVDSGVC